MKSFVCVLLFMFMLLVLPTTSMASQGVTAENPTQTTWGAVAVVPVTVVAEPSGGDVMRFKPGIGRKQRKAMGLTFRNVRKTIVQLQGTGDITEDMTTEEVSLVVFDFLVEQNPQGFSGGDPSRDWDSFFAFLERLVALLLKLMALFG